MPSGTVATGIVYETTSFPLWEAAIAAGATLDELSRIEDYPKKFQAMLIAWHQIHKMVALHEADAIETARRRASQH